MHWRMPLLRVAVVAALAGTPALPQEATGDAQRIPLTVAAGVPLRLYLVQRVPKRLGAPVHAKLIEPLFAFDREVVPAGTEVIGRVSRLGSESKVTRIAAGLNGDFTPRHEAFIDFSTLMLPDGRQVALQAAESRGLNSIYRPPKPTAKKDKSGPKNGGVLGIGKQKARERIDAAVNAPKGVIGVVRGPDKKQRLEDFLWSKLPYHPQRIRQGTRFDATLREPLPFGAASFKTQALELLGTQPPPDSLAEARLLTPLSSASAKKGDPIEAVISRPVFSPDHRLILPEGSRLTGVVTRARGARWFHRGGQLQFTFRKVDLPAGIARPVLVAGPQPREKTEATLEAAESGGKTPIKVDSEGGVKTAEKKTRLLAPALAAVLAVKASETKGPYDADENRMRSGVQNADGRALGGASGFGLLGVAAGLLNPTAATAIGFYGLAWSTYSAVVARGGEIEFGNNAAMEIRFGPPAAAAPPLGHKLAALAGGSR